MYIFCIRTVKMSVYTVQEVEDQERIGLLEELQAQQYNTQQVEKQVSTETFAQEVTHPSKQQEKTITKTNVEIIKEITSFNAQVHQTKIADNMQSTINQAKTGIEPKNAVSLIKNPQFQQPNLSQEIRQKRQRRIRIQKEIQDRRKEFYAIRQRQFQAKLNAQFKYLDDIEQERRKERQAQQSGNLLQILRQLFNFSKPDKKLTQ